MISRISGKLAQISDDTALVENNGVYYEIMLPSALADRMKEKNRIGDDISFETIYYIEAGDRKSNHYPRLVGFTNVIDREFFSMMTQVPGLGVKKALKSLILPIREIATAIEMKDAGSLNRLPGVGARLAEKIVAELHGKVAKFALSKENEPLSLDKKKLPAEPFVEEAMEVLSQLQYSRNEAQKMIATALESKVKISKVEELISIVFKNEKLQKVTS